MEPTDFLFLQWFVLDGLSEVLDVAGFTDEAEEVHAEAVRVSEEKGFVVGANRTRRRQEQARSAKAVPRRPSTPQPP